MFDLETEEFIVSRDVVLCKNIFPFTEQSLQPDEEDGDETNMQLWAPISSGFEFDMFCCKSQ